MPTDFAFSWFFIPTLVALAVNTVVAVTARQPLDGNAFLGLGTKRIALGFLGAMAALLAYSIVDSVVLALTKVELGHITRAEMPHKIPGWSIYLFVLVALPVTVVVATVGLPLFALLRRVRLASFVGVAVLALGYAGLRGWAVFQWPYNSWCSSHLEACVMGSLMEVSAFTVPIALGFGVGARLPLIRSRRVL